MAEVIRKLHPFHLFARHTFGDHDPWVYVTRDYGKSWQPLVNGVNNNGAHEVTIPANAGSAVRLKLACSDNIFFAISPLKLPVAQSSGSSGGGGGGSTCTTLFKGSNAYTGSGSTISINSNVGSCTKNGGNFTCSGVVAASGTVFTITSTKTSNQGVVSTVSGTAAANCSEVNGINLQ